MSIFKKKKSIDKEIYSLLEIMNDMDPTTTEYGKITERLATLAEAASMKKPKLSWDTIFVAGIGFAEVLVMLNYEKLGVISSKVLGRIPKGRV